MNDAETRKSDEASEADTVSIYPISQATPATFSELYFRLTFFFFIQRGSKHVETSSQGELLAEEGDVMIFPPGAMVTMENRPVMNEAYQALGVSFPHKLIDAVFADSPPPKVATNVQILRADPHDPETVLPLLRETLANNDLPDSIRQHRLIEPLIWAREHGVRLPTSVQDEPVSKVRRLIESDLAHPWVAGEVAEHLAMSEATMRRWLSKAGQGFAKILLHTRLERGLSLLQTTDLQISEISLDCGFKTPSHFSDAFRKRFGIQPKEIRSAAV